MTDIDHRTGVIEDYEPLAEIREAFHAGAREVFERTLRSLADELASEYRANIEEKICRWATSTIVLRFYDRPPPRAYIQAKMLYRDGFYEATIMVARSTAEMVCYDRLDGLQHPFGTVQQVEKRGFRELVRWLVGNDQRLTQTAFDRLNALYDLGNNYVHPKAGQNAKDDSLKALHLLGEAIFEVYGVKSIDDLVGRTMKTPYADYPDICSGSNFLLSGFLTPEAATAHAMPGCAPLSKKEGR